MTTRSILFSSLVLVFGAAALPAAESPTFRGPERDGHFQDKNLAASWPQGGPEALWSVTGAGEGFSSVAVAGGRLYTTGQVGKVGRLVAFDLAGKKLWQTEYGEEHPGSGFPGSRSTPSTGGEAVFVLSSNGRAVAAGAENGAIRWQVDLLAEYGGKNIHFGLSESPLLDGDRVIFTPGGKDASLVALDQKTGKLVWRSTGLSDKSAYCSARLVTVGGKSQVVTLLAKSVVSLDPVTGEVLWRAEREAQYDIHAVSPLFAGDIMILSHGYGQGTRGYQAADGEIRELWHQKKLDVHHGGGVVVGEVFHGAASKGAWYSLDIKDGSILKESGRLGKGSVIHADGKLFGYTEKGDVLLVDPKDLAVLGRFAITAGEGQHWAHPVISDGVLYIRHGDALMAFDISDPG